MHLNNSQFQAIQRMYDVRQADNRRILDERYQEVLAVVPEYAKVQQEITAIYARRARAAILGKEDSSQDALSALQDRLVTLLTGAGFPADYLEPIYDCPDCQDTGMIGSERCHCFKAAISDVLYAQSGLADKIATENFDTFDIRYYSEVPDQIYGISPRENMESILRIALDFIKHFDDPKGEASNTQPKAARNLLLYGRTGVGKSFLTNCIAKALLDSGHTVISLSSLDLFEILEDEAFDRKEEGDGCESMCDYIFDCDLLIIDDLGTELNNAFVTSRLFSCIDHRLSSGLSTIISTNLSLEDLQNSYSERIISRLIANYDIQMILGDDIRIKKAISGM